MDLIDAYYVDYDLLNYAQDHTIFVMPSALGRRHKLDGPYDLNILPFLPTITAAIHAIDTIVLAPPALAALVQSGPGAYHMALNHLRASYLYGLLVKENATGTAIVEDLLGWPYEPQ